MNLSTLFIFQQENQLTPAQWKKFKDKYIDKNPGTKSVITKNGDTEYLITKNDPMKPIIRYDKTTDKLMHDMSPKDYSEFIS